VLVCSLKTKLTSFSLFLALLHNSLSFSYLNDRIAEGKNSASKTKRTPCEYDSSSRVCPHVKTKLTRQRQLIGLEEILYDSSTDDFEEKKGKKHKKSRSYDRHANIVLFI
jgi:hypothetical protein